MFYSFTEILGSKASPPIITARGSIMLFPYTKDHQHYATLMWHTVFHIMFFSLKKIAAVDI